MSSLTGNLTPEAKAVWEVLFAKYAAPGMCNPDDPEPCTSGTPTQAQIDNDHRTLEQRQHDALVVIGRIALMSGELGQLNGLPVSIIIRTTLQDLESRAGVGVTGGGTVIPINDVIRMAAPRQPLSGGIRQGHRIGPGPIPGTTHRLPSATDHAHRPRRRLHQTLLHRRRLRQPSPSRRRAIGPITATPTSTRWPWPADPTTAASTKHGWTTTINTRGDVEWHPPPHTRHRPNPHQLLPPPRTTPPPTRRRPRTQTVQRIRACRHRRHGRSSSGRVQHGKRQRPGTVRCRDTHRQK